jgi:hypothetical protein
MERSSMKKIASVATLVAPALVVAGAALAGGGGAGRVA